LFNCEEEEVAIREWYARVHAGASVLFVVPTGAELSLELEPELAL
jgi:hypothetical protein